MIFQAKRAASACFIDTDTVRQNGIVHFITSIAPGGGTSFFHWPTT